MPIADESPDIMLAEGAGVTYGMGTIFKTGEVDHAVNASESSSSAAVSVGVELLLGQDITTTL